MTSNPLILLKAINYSGSGSWLDESGNGRNAILETGTISKNTAGNGIVLNGSTSWTFPNVEVGNSWTVFVWYKDISGFAATGQILAQMQGGSYAQINIGIGGWNGGIAGYFYTQAEGGNVNGTTINFTRNLWTNIQMTWNGLNLNTYINGVLLGSVQSNTAISISSGLGYRIGGFWWANQPSPYVTGEIGEVRIYDYAIDQTQITADYEASLIDFPIIPLELLNPNSTSNQKVYSIVTITLLRVDSSRNPIVGESISLTASDGLIYANQTTNSSGNVSFLVTSTALIQVTYTATSVASPSITQSCVVNYTSLAPLVLLRASDYSGSGAWLDESGKGRNATLENGSIAKNTNGNGIILNGSTSWTFPNVVVGNAWTANVWFKLTGNVEDYASILTQIQNNFHSNLSITSISGNNIFYGGFTNTAQGNWQFGNSISLTNNVWTNIQITWDGTNLVIYINGSLLGTTALTGPSEDSGTAYRIGRRLDGFNYVTGEIGEVRIYDYAIDQTKVTADYQASLPTFIWQPTAISNCRLWLDSSRLTYSNGSTITQWTDLTGNSTLSGTSPTLSTNVLNGFPVANFNTSQYLVVSPAFNSTKQSFFAVSRQTGGSNYRVFGSSTSNIFIGYYPGFKKDIFINFNPNIFATQASDTSWDLISLTLDTSIEYKFCWNGTQLYNGGTNSIDALQINGFVGSATQTSDCEIAEVIFYDNNTLSPYKRQVVEGYLAWKWGLQASLPSSHPFYNAPPTTNQLDPVLLLKAINYSGSGAWLDESGNNKNATKTLGTIAKNSDGNGIVLDGSTRWTFPNLTLGNAWSVNLWYKKIGAGNGLLGQNYNGAFMNLNILNDESNVGFYSLNWHYGSTVSLVIGAWTNIQVTWDGTYIITYINGVLLGSVQCGGIAQDSGLDYFIGISWQETSSVGEIGEVRIYKDAIDQSKVTSDYVESISTFIISIPLISIRPGVYSDAVELWWVKPEIGTPSYYRITCLEETVQPININYPNTFIRISGLTKFESYTFQIVAINNISSPMATFRTVRPDDKPIAPSTASATNITINGFTTISWTSSVSDYILGYAIILEPQPNGIPIKNSALPKATSLKISGLDISKSYIGYIYSVNDAGWSHPPVVTNTISYNP